jgi:hypothetical protein
MNNKTTTKKDEVKRFREIKKKKRKIRKWYTYFICRKVQSFVHLLIEVDCIGSGCQALACLNIYCIFKCFEGYRWYPQFHSRS